MPASLAPKQPAEESRYWDGRDPTEYHTDPQCRIGRWIPADSLYSGDTHAGRLCEVCADGGDEGALLFAI